MNDLTLGPLKAKEKKEGKSIIFRCGVLRCPEKLVESEPEVGGRLYRVCSGYMKNGQGIYIKTRRPPARDEETRRFARDVVETEDSGPTLSDFYDQLKKQGQENLTLESVIEQWSALKDEEQKQRALEPKKRIESDPKSHVHLRKHISDFLESRDLPLIFKCARCGNLSKISV